ncbi:MAG TPA: SRPBCC family protein [Myxococcales bacterium]|jgi:ribosome-associated toxin RatA of RatAB toxin-antitoxin module|nr:SRPBCC family protein [Myxococcales bacterium]
MPGASRSIVISAPAEKVFDVISGYEKYPEFMSEVKEVKVSNRKSNQVDVHYKVDLVKTIKYSLRMIEERPSKITWTFIEGEFMKDNKGSWTLEPAGDGQTKATYNIEIALGPLVPKTIVNAMVETSLPKMLDSIKKRVESGK